MMNHQFMKNNDSQSHTARCFLIACFRLWQHVKRFILLKLSAGNKAEKENNTGFKKKSSVISYTVQKTEQWKDGAGGVRVDPP